MTPAANLAHLEKLLRIWPMDIRLRRKVNALRLQLEAPTARNLREEIRRRIKTAPFEALVDVAAQLRSAS